MRRNILLRLEEDVYQKVLAFAAEMEAELGKSYTAGDIVRLALEYALATNDWQTSEN